MADLRGFDANTVEPNDSFDPLPNGDYLCIITASEMKPTKAGDGAYLELEMQVIEGQYQDRKLWDRLNLNNSNETAVRIARGALSSICRAVGVPQPKDSCELHDLPLLVKVACKKRDDAHECGSRSGVEYDLATTDEQKALLSETVRTIYGINEDRWYAGRPHWREMVRLHCITQKG